MNEINWNELKDKAHSNAVKHGFWEGKPSDKHFLCLVISELYGQSYHGSDNQPS